MMADDSSKPTEGGPEKGPSEGALSTPSDGGTGGPSIDEDGNRRARLGAGPVEVYAYHDYPMTPWRSPLYVGARLGPVRAGALLGPESLLRPFSGGRR